VSSTAPSPDALVGDPLYPRLKEHVVGSTGLAYYADKDADLARRISHRLSSLGMRDCASYLDMLRNPLRGPAELDALIAEITIGETYFFRHQEHFDALRDLVIPDLIARNPARRSLRIWCAGCADGPEPYSLAILLKRDMAHHLLGWDVTILGTDINRRCLARASEGKFEEWAFRSTSEDLKRTCFGKEGRLWSIAPEYKEWVSFQYHNLVEHSFPSLLNNLFCFDLIVCRNVMIYFAPDLMQRMIEQFHDCLVPGAWLLVGPSEPNMNYFSSFRTVNAPGVTLYQKPDAEYVGQDDILRPIVGRPTGDEADAASRPIDNRPQVDNLPHKVTLADVRHHADQGEWESAARLCEQLLRKDNLNSVVHFYQALVLGQMRRQDEAERSLRRAIYLDRQFVLAHYYLGIFLQSHGDLRLAARSFQNTLDLLRSRRDTDILADADGITVAELKKLAKMHLEILLERG
jgi:chemotaxis protein methyltransferase CheR